jgi:hypothetical protein
MTAREAFGMGEERLIEHLLAGGVEPRRLAGVHGRGRHVADPGVPMGEAGRQAERGVVVPGEESLTERPGVRLVETLGIRDYSFRSCTSTSGSAASPTAYRILCLRLARLVRSLSATPPRTQGSIRVGG